MRERILEAIYKKIDEDPQNLQLQKQITLLNKANISTMHSFCLDVIRNNFYEIDASANFRVADSAEIELLKQDIIEDLFEEKYVNEDKDFSKILNIYADYRGDENLIELILNIHKFIQSCPFPEKWLKEQIEKYNLSNSLENDFAKSEWGEIILASVKETVLESILKLKQIAKQASKYDELTKHKIIVEECIEILEIVNKKEYTWDELYNIINNMDFPTWPRKTNNTPDIAADMKKILDSIKKKITDLKTKVFFCTSKQANSDINEMYEILKIIGNLVIEFSQKFAAKKKEKNIVDFNDIEHFALKILLKEDENGNIIETDVAKKYKEKFEEIAVDEYQDSNLVQESIIKSVSKGNNVFMVGDVKQSIYKFRQAMPELFLDKYNTYKLKGNEIDLGLKIQLFKNFRSRENVLSVTNMIFENIMSENLGDIDYNENEFLNYGANYPDPTDTNLEIEGEYSFAGIAELDILDVKPPQEDMFSKIAKDEDTIEEGTKENSSTDVNNVSIDVNTESIKVLLSTDKTKSSGENSEDETQENENSDNTNQNEERVEDVVFEAKYVAQKIKEIIDSNYIVYDRKKGYRKVTYKDIVVLLRSTKIAAPIFEKEISNLNMPVFSDTSSEYLETIEIQTIMSLLKIIDNPMQDIPLITVLRSSICGFTDNELVQIRGKDKNISFYESLINFKDNINNRKVDNELIEKVNLFVKNLKKWQDEEKYMSLDELIWQIYTDTNFYNYVTLLPNGSLRQANLKMLFERAKQYENASFKGLFNFINFIDKLHSNSGDLSAAKLIGENENVIRIMSIHKSKGLEFPIVFLSTMGKQFNLRDLNDNIILHQTLGFGAKYVDYDTKISYSTLARDAIRLKAKTETLSEEMRVLYVALTRAKEKLFITGVSKDAEKSLAEKEILLQMYKDDEENNKNINHILLKKYQTYLDWIELVYFNNKEKSDNYMKINVIKKHEFLENLKNEEESEKENILKNLNDRAHKLDNKNNFAKILKWKYFYMDSSVIPTKTSVTKLKEMENENVVSLEELEQESSFAVARPQFLNEKVEITGAQKGTLMHLCFQKLDEKKQYTKHDIQQMIDDLVTRKIITELEAKSINTYKLYSYTKSDLFNKLRKAKAVYKEQPFYINLTSDEVYGNGLDDNILVQGIIDLYYIDENGKVILVDYKTDFVEKDKENNLIEKYKKQLQIYKKALEQALDREVEDCYIYSVYLEKLLKVNV